MKYLKLILSIIAITISTLSFSQGNLQYSQAKLVSTQDTVPTGKVWKIEGVIYATQVPSASNYNSTVIDEININGSLVVVRKSSSYSNGVYVTQSIIWEQKFPLWMPAGTTLAASNGVLYINMLEFNEVP